jgi:hypothetical protein
MNTWTLLLTDGRRTRQSKQSRKAEIITSYYQWQILKPSGKRRAKEELHNFCQNTKMDRGERYFEMSSPWLREIKMNCRAYVSINCMTEGHSSLKASLSRFNIVSTAECNGMW